MIRIINGVWDMTSNDNILDKDTLPFIKQKLITRLQEIKGNCWWSETGLSIKEGDPKQLQYEVESIIKNTDRVSECNITDISLDKGNLKLSVDIKLDNQETIKLSI